MQNKDLYSEFVRSNYVPIFAKPFWLDAVCGKENWDVLALKKNELEVFLPYFFKPLKKIFRQITLPKLTPRLGFFSNKPLSIYEQNLLYGELINQLPNVDYILLIGNDENLNCLPLYRNGFLSEIRHSHVIEDISNQDIVFSAFNLNKKRNIKKAKEIVEIKKGLEFDKFYELKANSVRVMSYSFTFLQKLFNTCKENNCVEIFYAIDAKNNIHSALFCVWDERYAYHLIPAINSQYSKSQSMSLIVLEAINHLRNKTKGYDFEGGMSENIGNAYLSYGSVLKSYLYSRKYNNKFIEIFEKLAK